MLNTTCSFQWISWKIHPARLIQPARVIGTPEYPCNASIKLSRHYVFTPLLGGNQAYFCTVEIFLGKEDETFQNSFSFHKVSSLYRKIFLRSIYCKSLKEDGKKLFFLFYHSFKSVSAFKKISLNKVKEVHKKVHIHIFGILASE